MRATNLDGLERMPAYVGVPDLPCRKVDPELFFPPPKTTGAEAKKLCRPCPARAGCLAYALEHGERHGIWGGTTPPERGFTRTVDDPDELPDDGPQLWFAAGRALLAGVVRQAVAKRYAVDPRPAAGAALVLEYMPHLEGEVLAGRLRMDDAVLAAVAAKRTADAGSGPRVRPKQPGAPLRTPVDVLFAAAREVLAGRSAWDVATRRGVSYKALLRAVKVADRTPDRVADVVAGRVSMASAVARATGRWPG